MCYIFGDFYIFRIAPELGPTFDGAWVLLTLFAVSVEYGSAGIGLSVKFVFPHSAQHLVA